MLAAPREVRGEQRITEPDETPPQTGGSKIDLGLMVRVMVQAAAVPRVTE